MVKDFNLLKYYILDTNKKLIKPINKLKNNIMQNYELKENKILRYEPYFNERVATAIINHELKEIRPTHGYFYPHKYGKMNKQLAKKIGYSFNNN